MVSILAAGEIYASTIARASTGFDWANITIINPRTDITSL